MQKDCAVHGRREREAGVGEERESKASEEGQRGGMVPAHSTEVRLYEDGKEEAPADSEPEGREIHEVQPRRKSEP